MSVDLLTLECLKVHFHDVILESFLRVIYIGPSTLLRLFDVYSKDYR